MTGTELPICVSVASDLLFKEENLRLLPGQERRLMLLCFLGPSYQHPEFPAAGNWKA